MQNSKMNAQYEANRVEGRSHIDPRKGYYKILSTFQDQAFKKHAEKAKVNWKLSIEDDYSTDEHIIQIETFKKGLTTLDTSNIIGKEIKVLSASWYAVNKEFIVNFEILTPKQEALDRINARVIANIDKIDLDATVKYDLQIEDLNSHDEEDIQLIDDIERLNQY